MIPGCPTASGEYDEAAEAGVGIITYVIPAAGQDSADANEVTKVSTANIDAGKHSDGTEQYIDPNTGGAAPGYQGDYVYAAAGGGTTNLGQDGYAAREGTLQDASNTIQRTRRSDGARNL